MPRKKIADVAPGQTTCPVCASSFSSDGKTFLKSAKLLVFERDREVIDTLEKMVTKLEEMDKEKDQKIVSLELQLKDANAKLEAANVVGERQRSERPRQRDTRDDW
jgi:H2-forming N5,N10-methylenetetrahydromethanopterin dehydrogenase-like enzyme